MTHLEQSTACSTFHLALKMSTPTTINILMFAFFPFRRKLLTIACLSPCNNRYTSWDRKVPYSEFSDKSWCRDDWNIESFFESILINIKEYKHVFQVESHYDRFSDSGAVYFTMNKLGFIPFAIHFCGSDEGRYGYQWCFGEDKKIHWIHRCSVCMNEELCDIRTGMLAVTSF